MFYRHQKISGFPSGKPYLLMKSPGEGIRGGCGFATKTFYGNGRADIWNILNLYYRREGGKKLMVSVQSKRQCLTVKEIQNEFINMDSRKLRAFLNAHLHYKKIGHTYYYIRREVEALLLNESQKQEFSVKGY